MSHRRAAATAVLSSLPLLGIATGCQQSGLMTPTTTRISPLPNNPPAAAMPNFNFGPLSPNAAGARVAPPSTGSFGGPAAPGYAPAYGPAAASPIGSGTANLAAAPVPPGPTTGGMRVHDLTTAPPPPGYSAPYALAAPMPTAPPAGQYVAAPRPYPPTPIVPSTQVATGFSGGARPSTEPVIQQTGGQLQWGP